jgi:hypothetical protein
MLKHSGIVQNAFNQTKDMNRIFLAPYLGANFTSNLMHLAMCIHHRFNPWKLNIPDILKHPI